MFALVDCNSCYASCEQIFRPDLRGKPVVVLSNNDGCIVARNKEAKALSIPDMQPYFQLKAFLEQAKVTVFSSNYELYGDISKRVMATLARFSPNMEVYSIDEAFLDVTGFSNLREHGLAIKHTVWKEQRMPVCVGIAPTKTLAKLANHIAKQAPRLDGVCVIEQIEPWQKLFSKLDVAKVWGVGSKLAKRLHEIGIYSVEDLRRQNSSAIHKRFNITLAKTVRELNGESCLPLELQPPPKQQIFCSRSFGKKVTDKTELLEAIADYAARAAMKLRQQQSLCQCVYVTVQTSRFSDNRYFNSQTKALSFPSNDTRTLISIALQIGESLFQPHYAYAKVGVGLLDLCPDSHQQGDLFSAGQGEQSKALMAVFDRINQRYGNGTAFIAKQGIRREWQMARSMKSPAYTTRLSDLPIIRL